MRKKIVFILIFISIIIMSFILLNIYNNKKEENEKKLKKESKIAEVKSHYNKYVSTNAKTKLYRLVDGKFIEYGDVNEGVRFELGDVDIDENTKYFYIDDFDLYILYKDVDSIDSIEKNDRYKNYIPFDINIKTADNTSFYDASGNYLYTIHDSFDLPVIVKYSDKYGVIFNDELLYVNSEDVKEKYEKNNNSTNKSRIKVLTYHFLYNPEKTSCDQSICQSLDMFESHLKYIRENDYFTLTLSELEMYLDENINIPNKSIVLTIDDGTMIDLDALKLLEQYKVNATLFVITSWVTTDDLKSEYLDLESHTDNMHNQYECAGYGMQGGGILCLPEDQVLNDLKTSQEKLGGSKYFAYPFFDFNARAIELLKKAGFTMAFIGQYDTDGYSYPNKTDKFKVRRKTIFSDITMDEFISYLK